MNPVNVVCGIIYNGDKILICRRKPGKSLAGYWEFPGGKINKGEAPKEALHRELEEELGMQVNIGERFTENEHSYSDFKINLIAFTCEFVNASFKLTDHDTYEWVNLEDLTNWKLAPADNPIAKKLY